MTRRGNPEHDYQQAPDVTVVNYSFFKRKEKKDKIKKRKTTK